MRLGIIRTSSIGDVVLATVCINFLKKNFQNFQIVWIGKQPSLSLIKDAFPDIKCIEIQKRTKVKEILEQMCDLDFLVDLQTNLRSRILSHSFKAKYRKPIFVSSKHQVLRNRLILEARIYGRKRTLPARVLRPLKPQFELMRDSLISALSSLKILTDASKNLEGIFPIIPTEHFLDKTFYVEKMKGHRWIAISPGASYETKKAPKELWLKILKGVDDLVNKRTSRGKVGLLFLGDHKDSFDCKELEKELKWGGPQLHLAGELSLWQNAVVLKRAAVLLSNDSSLAHIAEAVETPVCVLFGPTVEAFGFSPRKKESFSFSSNVGCRPCSKHGKEACRFSDKLCFAQISSENVIEKIQSILENVECDNEK